MARVYPFLIVLFWIGSMSWLLMTKVLPPLKGGDPPDYSAALVPRDTNSEPVCWRITWKSRRIGTAVSQTVPRSGGGNSLRQIVHFKSLPFEAMVSEGFGLLGSFLKPVLREDLNLEVDMRLATELRFDARRQFTDFQTVVDLADIQGFLVLRGIMTEQETMRVTTRFSSSAGTQEPQLQQEINLPRRALVGDAFAPRPELTNLRVGQKWTIPVYRPFPPQSSVRIVEAIAARLEVIVWNGRDVETILVEYREDAGTGLHASREPVAREWVRADGSVLRQELQLSGLTVMFERLPSQVVGQDLDPLDAAKYPRLWLPDTPNRSVPISANTP